MSTHQSRSRHRMPLRRPATFLAAAATTLALAPAAHAATGPTISLVSGLAQTTSTETIVGNSKLNDAATATALVQWGTTTSYGSTQWQTLSHTAGNTQSQAYGFDLGGLAAGTVYHYKVTLTSSGFPTVTSGDKTFVTGAAPTLSLISALDQGPGAVNVVANGRLYGAPTANTTLKYGLTTSYGSTQTLQVAHDTTADTNNVWAYELTGLQAGKQYHYQVVSSTAFGTATSADKTFVVQAPPTLGTISATKFNATSTTVSVYSQLYAASSGTVTVKYGKTAAYGTTQSLTTTHDPTSTNTNLDGFSLSGLTTGSTYHYQVTVTTTHGTVTSTDRTFVAGA